MKIIWFLWVVCFGSLVAMPSYQDVLLVVKSGDAKSLEVANYFKAARGLPNANVVTLACAGSTGSIISMAQRDTFLNDLSNAIATSGLESKLNYIVLSSGFPAKARDNAAGTLTTFLDLFIMYRLSPLYPGFWFTNNTYAYTRNENYNNRKNIKYSKAKYGHYILTRLDGPSVSAIKKMIDSFGPAAYNSAEAGIKYVVDSQSQYLADGAQYHYSEIRNNVESRGGVFVDWKTNDGILYGLKDISFLDCDWVVGTDGAYSRSAPITAYPHPFKHLTFKPGSLMNVYRSFPTGDGQFGSSRAGLYAHSAGVLTSQMMTDGSDYKLQNIGSLALNEDDHELWAGLGVNPAHVGRGGRDYNSVANEFQNGNGVAVYDKTGKLKAHHTRQNTGGGLLSDAVFTMAYDRFNRRMWVGTFAGVCYLDLNTKSWGTPAGLSHPNGAFVHQIYVDPTTSGQRIFVTFTYGGISSGTVVNQIANYQRVFQHNTATLATSSHQFGIAGTFYNAQVVKTEPTVLWMRYSTSGNASYVAKINLNTETASYTLDLANVGGVDYRPHSTYTRNMANIIASVVAGVTNIYLPIGNSNAATVIKNGVLRITDNGASQVVTAWGQDLWTNTDPLVLGARVFQNPFHPEKVYLFTRNHNAVLSGYGKVIEFSAGNPTGTEIKNGSASLVSVNDAVFDEQTDGKMWLAQYQQYGVGQFAIYELFNDGLSGAMGGFSHDSFYYDGVMPFGSWNASLFIPSANPDFHLYTAESSGSKTMMTMHQMRGMAMLLMDGFYFAEARYGSLPEYPSQGNGGHYAHMLVMDPKAAPYAPRVDAATDLKIKKNGNEYQFSVRLKSPTALPSENTFLSETINAGTVRLSDLNNMNIPASSIKYSSADNSILVSTTASLDEKSKYVLTLACGIDGIKNYRGASLVNVKPDEFKDEVSLEYSFPPAAATSEQTRILSLSPAFAFQSGKTLVIQFSLKERVANAVLEIFTMQGEKVKTLKGGDFNLEARQGKWNGLWDNGNAKSGLYLVILRVDGKQEDMRKVVLLRDAGGL